MFITLFALITAVLLETLTPDAVEIVSSYATPVMLTGGTVILLANLLINLLPLNSFVLLEQQVIPNLSSLLKNDRRLFLARLALYFFPVLSYAACGLIVSEGPQHYHAFLIWIILFSLSLDLLRDSWKRIIHFLTPSQIVVQLEQNAIKSVQQDEDELLWSHIDELSEIAIRSVESSKLALSTQVLKTFPPIVHSFFASSKSISRLNNDREIEKETGRDEASYTIFYLLQRLELINDKALINRLETVCRQMIMSMGKIIIYSCEFDLSMVSFPTHFLTKFGLKAQQHHFNEVAVLTTSTLIEIAKYITTQIDLTYAQLDDPFQSILNGLDALAKAAFKKDKNENISTLTQPFLEIKNLFTTPKMLAHRDTPSILSRIDAILEEYQTLDKMMKGIPSLEME